MPAPRKKNKDEFLSRWGKIDAYIPLNYEKAVLRKYPNKKITTIQNTRYGKTMDFQILEVLEELVNQNK